MLFENDCPFLALPGELRNRIYQYSIVRSKPFAVKLQFSSRDTALLQVNRQIYREASTIFYSENTFKLSEGLFLGAPILQHLDSFYHVSLEKLRMMRKFIIDVPVCCLLTRIPIEFI